MKNNFLVSGYLILILSQFSGIYAALVPENKYLDGTNLDTILQKYLEKREKFVPFETRFYSKEEVKGQIPSSGVKGSTLKEALKGNGLLQVAVDPKIIPIFTRFNIKLWDGGESVKAIALDVGRSIENNLIDIFVDNNSEAILLGRKKVYLEFNSN